MSVQKVTVKAPNGYEIIGTAEMVLCTAYINDDGWTRKPDGSLDFDHSGTNEIHWDSQKGLYRDGKILFADEDGGEWLENDLVVTTLDEEPAQAPAVEPSAQDKVLGALKKLLNQYVQLGNSGDAGWWDTDNLPEVIEARAAIAAAEGTP